MNRQIHLVGAGASWVKVDMHYPLRIAMAAGELPEAYCKAPV